MKAIIEKVPMEKDVALEIVKSTDSLEIVGKIGTFCFFIGL